jgi:hypothetical protein
MELNSFFWVLSSFLPPRQLEGKMSLGERFLPGKYFSFLGNLVDKLVRPRRKGSWN